MRLSHKVLPVVCTLAISLLACTAAQADTAIGLLRAFGAGQVSFPYGVAVDPASGGVYVGDYSIGVGKFDSAQMLQFNFGPGGSHPLVSGVAVDPVNHDLYVVAAYKQEIQTYDPSSEASSKSPVSQFSVSGSGSGGGATEEQIAADSAGNVYFPNASHNEVQVFSPAGGAPGGGIAATITGSSGDALKGPGGVAVSTAGPTKGDIYVADTGNGRVEEFSPSGVFIMAFGAGDGTQAVAVDSSDDIYALDIGSSGYHVVEYDSAGTQLADFGSGVIGAPSFVANTLAVDSLTGDVYVTIDKEEAPNFGEVLVFGPVTVPHATTGSATSGPALKPPLPPTSEQLSGTVTAFGIAASYRFEYGTSTAYGSSAPAPPASAGSGYLPETASTILSGLEGSTTYHYRLVAANERGSSPPGADREFTTPAVAPAVGAAPPAEVTQTAATLAGTVDPEKQATSYHFEHVNAIRYNPEAPDPYSAGGETPDASAGSGSGPEPVSQPLGVPLTPNTLYHYRLVAVNATGRTNGPDETFTTLPLAPVCTPGQPAGLTDTSVTLNGVVNPQGAYTTYQFKYGTSIAYGSTAPVPPAFVGTDSNDASVSTSLTSLIPNTTYHYRLLATAANARGSTVAECPDQTFTTPAAPPLITITLTGPPWVSTNPATQIASTSATLTGSVTPVGTPTTYHFDYGTSASYGSSAPVPDASAGSGTSEQQETLDLTGLAPGTTYHYRIVATATNSSGPITEITITDGPDQTFTTLPTQAGAVTGNPFSPGTATISPLAAIPLLSIPTFLPPPTETTTPTPKPLTNAQKLAKALKVCKKDKSKHNRVSCEKQAGKRYASKPKAKK